MPDRLLEQLREELSKVSSRLDRAANALTDARVALLRESAARDEAEARALLAEAELETARWDCLDLQERAETAEAWLAIADEERRAEREEWALDKD